MYGAELVLWECAVTLMPVSCDEKAFTGEREVFVMGLLRYTVSKPKAIRRICFL